MISITNEAVTVASLDSYYNNILTNIAEQGFASYQGITGDDASGYHKTFPTPTSIEKKYSDPKEQAFEWIFSDLGFSVESIKDNKATIEKFMQELLPGKVITFVNLPNFHVSTDTGTIVPSDLDVPKKFLEVSRRRIKSQNDFNPADFKSKYVYIYEILPTHPLGSGVANTSWDIRMAEFNPGKKNVSFTIDENIYEMFLDLSEKMAINKSKFVENKIREFLEKNKS